MNHLKHDHINVGNNDHNDMQCIPQYICDQCEKPTDKVNNVNDEGFCDDCFNDAYEKERDAMTGGPDDDPRKGL